MRWGIIMNIREISEEFNKRVLISRRISIVKNRMERMEDHDSKKYILLKSFVEKYEMFDKGSNQILDEIIGDKVIDDEKDSYFCFGKDFFGIPRESGGYCITSNSPYRILDRLSRYKSVRNPKEEIIILSSESLNFDREHSIIYQRANDPEEEYKEIRRFKVLTQIKKLEAGKAFVKRAS